MSENDKSNFIYYKFISKNDNQNVEEKKGRENMLKRKKWLMVVYCFLLSFMVLIIGGKSVDAKKKKSSVKIYSSTFSRVVKASPRITSIRIAKGKCVIKGSFKLINKKGKTIKRYASKKRSYKISKKFSVYMNDETVYKIRRSEWNKQIKNIEKYGCVDVYIYKKGNELTKLVFSD